MGKDEILAIRIANALLRSGLLNAKLDENVQIPDLTEPVHIIKQEIIGFSLNPPPAEA